MRMRRGTLSSTSTPPPRSAAIVRSTNGAVAEGAIRLIPFDGVPESFERLAHRADVVARIERPEVEARAPVGDRREDELAIRDALGRGHPDPDVAQRMADGDDRPWRHG